LTSQPEEKHGIDTKGIINQDQTPTQDKKILSPIGGLQPTRQPLQNLS